MAEDPTFEVWKVTIDVQKHFNDLGLRVRSLAVAILAALMAAAGYALKENETVPLFGQQRSLAGLILLAALVCWIACYVMDRLWYHRLLQAAVAHGRKVEADLSVRIPNITLTTAIDNASPIRGLRAYHRLSIFYASIAIILIVGAGVALEGSRIYWGFWAMVGLFVLVLRYWPNRKSPTT